MKTSSLDHGWTPCFLLPPLHSSAPLFQSQLPEKVVCIHCLQFFPCPLLKVLQVDFLFNHCTKTTSDLQDQRSPCCSIQWSLLSLHLTWPVSNIDSADCSSSLKLFLSLVSGKLQALAFLPPSLTVPFQSSSLFLLLRPDLVKLLGFGAQGLDRFPMCINCCN